MVNYHKHQLQAFVVLFIIADFIVETVRVQFMIMKNNIIVDSNYTFDIIITQGQSSVSPINTYLTHQINNSISTTNQYFDYFRYLSTPDTECYVYSVGNSSYLYPCPFLLNNNQTLRSSSAKDVISNDKGKIHQFNQIQQHFIVDNTPYPFPGGAQPYSNLSIKTLTNITVQCTDIYKDTGIKLIFINGTLLLIYATAIGILIYKIYKIQKKNPQPNKTEAISQQIRKREKTYHSDSQSDDIDNYQSKQQSGSKWSRQFSMLSSYEERKIMNKFHLLN